MTKDASTQFGQPLSPESKKLVNEVRLKLKEPIHPNFNTDFNIYRFVLNAERQFNKSKEVVEYAAKALNNHLRYRRCLHLDEMEDVPFSKNPIFIRRLLPCGQIQKTTDTNNRLLWYVEYATISVEGLASTLRSSAACRYQFWQFEHMLRRVNEQEEATGRFSSLRHVVDLTGYEINPFEMLFVSSGALSYYSTLFHYEMFPELVYPVEIVNVARWVHMPYRLIKTVMPAGFADRFRLFDSTFLNELKKEVKLEDIPETLGGLDKDIRCISAIKPKPEEHWKPPSEKILAELETLHISAKKQKIFKIEVAENSPRRTLAWYYKTDGDVYFGVFFDPQNNQSSKDKKKEDKEFFDVENNEMVYPLLKITAKLVHEFDYVDLERPGTYYAVFCNKHSWLHRRTVDVMFQTSAVDGTEPRRVYHDGTTSAIEEGILKSLQLRDFKDYS
uniref:CRAL-TRIO domain-containing protein n=1 Tax=Panagrolaimus sp. JU765 TaxID=591449 RepID=A0AC34RFE6_9BILA